jgi:hypothetical protein
MLKKEAKKSYLSHQSRRWKRELKIKNKSDEVKKKEGDQTCESRTRDKEIVSK